MSYDSENYQAQVRQAEALERIADALEYFVAEDKGLVLVKPPEPEPGPAEGVWTNAPEHNVEVKTAPRVGAECITCGLPIAYDTKTKEFVHEGEQS